MKLERSSMKSDGVMTKGVGLHSVNRAVYRSQVSVQDVYKKLY